MCHVSMINRSPLTSTMYTTFSWPLATRESPDHLSTTCRHGHLMRPRPHDPQPAALFEAPEGVVHMTSEAYSAYLCTRPVVPNEEVGFGTRTVRPRRKRRLRRRRCVHPGRAPKPGSQAERSCRSTGAEPSEPGGGLASASPRRARRRRDLSRSRIPSTVGRSTQIPQATPDPLSCRGSTSGKWGSEGPR
jgi:hypothetical protein